MSATIIHPFKEPKNQEFKLYVSPIAVDNPEIFKWTTTALQARVSKDGGNFATATNAVVQEDVDNQGGQEGKYALISLTLTATEMNADVIAINILDNPLAGTDEIEAIGYIIYTVEDELASATTKSSSLTDKMLALYEYFFHRRTVNATTETLYKDDGTSTVSTATYSDNGTIVDRGKHT